MNSYKTITYKSSNGDVECYVYKNEIFVAQIEIAKLLNVTKGWMTKTIQNMSLSNKQVYKTKLSFSKTKAHFYNVESIVKIGKWLGKFEVFDFQKWAEEMLDNQYIQESDELKIVRFNRENIHIDVKVDQINRTIWLTQEQLSILLETSKSNISERINDIYADGELEKGATVRIFLTVQT